MTPSTQATTNTMNSSRSECSCRSVGRVRAGKRTKKSSANRFPVSPSGVRKRNSTAARSNIPHTTEKQDEEPQNGTHTVTSDGQSSMSGLSKTYTGHVFASGSASVVLGDINQLFVVNVGSDRQIPELLGQIKRVASPHWLLETSSQFRADAYTQESQELTLFNYFGDEIQRTETSQSHIFNMLYRSDSNNVITVVLSLKVSKRSKYWHTFTSDSPSRNTNDSLPADLLADIAKWIHKNKSNKRYICLSGLSDETFRLNIYKDSWDRATRFQAALRSRLRELSDHLKHWQCPWYYEDHLPRRILFRGRRSYYSLVYIPDKCKWACETRFCPSKITFESQIYTLRVLHCLELRGCTGIQRFLGVVRDNRDCTVAFLTELPAKGVLVDIMQEANRMGRPVSRERREKWCRQLLHLVAEVHRQTYVVGMLGLRLAGVFAVDADDSVVLSALLRPMLINYHPYPGSIPPEHRDSRSTVQATPQTDLFQLGLVLWKIAGNKLHERGGDFCASFGCPNDPSEPCSEPHADPIAIKMADGEYDEDLRRVIDICRSENPNHRGTAAGLLKMFPGPIHACDDQDTASVSGAPLTAEDYQRLRGSLVGCEFCGLFCAEHSFHCNICDKGDFDICFPCFRKPLHCHQEEHLLYEYRDEVLTGKYFSNVKGSGRREVFHL